MFNTILEDLFYLQKTLRTLKQNDITQFTRISIVFAYTSLETLRDFYCTQLNVKKIKKTREYSWESFFRYGEHEENINFILQPKKQTEFVKAFQKNKIFKKRFKNIKKYKDFKTDEDLKKFINELRLSRNAILHRSSFSPKDYNQHLKTSLRKTSKSEVQKIFSKTINCIEIMSYITEVNLKSF